MPGIMRESTGNPAMVPAPISSRMEPIMHSVRVNPSPIPIPSRAESTTEFLLANISARPRMMQLTTIRGRYSPRDSSRAGANALTISWTIVTKPAMTVI